MTADVNITSNIKLLPLPTPDWHDDGILPPSFDAYRECTMLAYANANVTHATAAKDAEIEALRAEVAAVWNAMPSGTRYLDPPDGGDVPLHEQVRRMAADAVRAERLAEALWIAEAALADIGDADREPGDDVEWCERRAALGLRVVRAVLEQENDDA